MILSGILVLKTEISFNSQNFKTPFAREDNGGCSDKELMFPMLDNTNTENNNYVLTAQMTFDIIACEPPRQISLISTVNPAVEMRAQMSWMLWCQNVGTE